MSRVISRPNASNSPLDAPRSRRRANSNLAISGGRTSKHRRRKSRRPHAERLEARRVLAVAILDNADPGFETSGQWETTQRRTFDGSAVVAAEDTQNASATWTFDDVKSGDYRLATNWFGDPDHSAEVTYEIRHGERLLQSITADQSVKSNGDYVRDRFSFQLLGSEFTVTSGQVTLRLDAPVGGVAVADAAMLIPVDLDATQPAAKPATNELAAGQVKEAPKHRTIVIAEDENHVFHESEFPLESADRSVISGMTLLTVPSVGTLLNNGVPVHAGDKIDTGSVRQGRISYRPAADDAGVGLHTFEIEIYDSFGRPADRSNIRLLVNEQPRLISASLRLTDTSGRAIKEVETGVPFVAEVWVRSHDGEDTGEAIRSALFDLDFNADILRPTGLAEPHDDFATHGRAGRLDDGRLVSFGGIASGDRGEREASRFRIATIPFTAMKPGSLDFQLHPASSDSTAFIIGHSTVVPHGSVDIINADFEGAIGDPIPPEPTGPQMFNGSGGGTSSAMSSGYGSDGVVQEPHAVFAHFSDGYDAGDSPSEELFDFVVPMDFNKSALDRMFVRVSVADNAHVRPFGYRTDAMCLGGEVEGVCSMGQAIVSNGYVYYEIDYSGSQVASTGVITVAVKALEDTIEAESSMNADFELYYLFDTHTSNPTPSKSPSSSSNRTGTLPGSQSVTVLDPKEEFKPVIKSNTAEGDGFERVFQFEPESTGIDGVEIETNTSDGSVAIDPPGEFFRRGLRALVRVQNPNPTLNRDATPRGGTGVDATDYEFRYALDYILYDANNERIPGTHTAQGVLHLGPNPVSSSNGEDVFIFGNNVSHGFFNFSPSTVLLDDDTYGTRFNFRFSIVVNAKADSLQENDESIRVDLETNLSPINSSGDLPIGPFGYIRYFDNETVYIENRTEPVYTEMDLTEPCLCAENVFDVDKQSGGVTVRPDSRALLPTSKTGTPHSADSSVRVSISGQPPEGPPGGSGYSPVTWPHTLTSTVTASHEALDANGDVIFDQSGDPTLERALLSEDPYGYDDLSYTQNMDPSYGSEEGQDRLAYRLPLYFEKSTMRSGGYLVKTNVDGRNSNGVLERNWKGESVFLSNDLMLDYQLAPGFSFDFADRLVVGTVYGGDEERASHQGGALLRGDGTASWFQGQGIFKSPPETSSRLDIVNGVYTIIHADQSEDRFAEQAWDDGMRKMFLLTEKVDPSGNVTAFTYTDGELASMTTPLGLTTEFALNDNGSQNSLTITEPNDNETTITYNHSFSYGQPMRRMTIDHPEPEVPAGASDLLPDSQGVGHDRLREIIQLDSDGFVSYIERQSIGPNGSQTAIDPQRTSFAYSYLYSGVGYNGEDRYKRLESLTRPDGSFQQLERFGMQESLPKTFGGWNMYIGSGQSATAITTIAREDRTTPADWKETFDDAADNQRVTHDIRNSFEHFTNAAITTNDGVTTHWGLDRLGRTIAVEDAHEAVSQIERYYEYDQETFEIERHWGLLKKTTSPDPDGGGAMAARVTEYTYLEDKPFWTSTKLPEIDGVTHHLAAPSIHATGVPTMYVDELGTVTTYSRTSGGLVTRVNVAMSPLVAQDNWTNPFNPFDVDLDGEVTTNDSVSILDEINANGSGPLGNLPTPPPELAYDVNDDGDISTADSTMVVDELDRIDNETSSNDSRQTTTFAYLGIGSDYATAYAQLPAVPTTSSLGSFYTRPSSVPTFALTGMVGLTRSQSYQADGDSFVMYEYIHDPGSTQHGQVAAKHEGEVTGTSYQFVASTYFTRDGSGYVDQVLDPLLRVTDYDYDNLGRLYQVTLEDPDGAGPMFKPSIAYRYDAYGNRLQAVETGETVDAPMSSFSGDPTGSLAPDAALTLRKRTTTMFYDNMNRLTAIWGNEPHDDTLPGDDTLQTINNGVTHVPSGGSGRPFRGYKYNDRNELVEHNDGNFAPSTFLYEYDDLGRMTKITAPQIQIDGSSTAVRPVTTMNYFATGTVHKKTDPDGLVTTYEVDAWDRPVDVTEGGGNTRYTTFDYSLPDVGDRTRGWTVHQTDAGGSAAERVQLKQLDRLGGIVENTFDFENSHSEDAAFRFSLDTDRSAMILMDEEYRTTYFLRDIAGQTSHIVSPDVVGAGGIPKSSIETFNYDAAGQLVSQVDAAGRQTDYDYDPLGRVVEVETPDPNSGSNPDAPITTYRYDSFGDLLQVKRGRTATGRVPVHTVNAYDHLGRLAWTQQGTDEPTTYLYSVRGDLEQVRDPEDNVTEFDYDAISRLESEQITTGGNTATRTYRYDIVNNLMQSTDREGRIIRYSYDGLRRPVSEKWYTDQAAVTNGNIGYTISRGYDAADRLTHISDAATAGGAADTFAYDNAYDDGDRLLAQSLKYLGPIGGSSGSITVGLTHQYDGAGNRTVTSAHRGGSLGSNGTWTGGTADYTNTMLYDGQNNLYSLIQDGTGVADKTVILGYHADGRLDLLSRSTPTGSTINSEYDYDFAGRIDQIQHRLGSSPIETHDYAYDAVNQLVAINHSANLGSFAGGGYTGLGLTSFEHNTTGQLTEEAFAPGSGQADQTYTYDDAGNRTMSGYVTGDFNTLEDDGTWQYSYNASGTTGGPIGEGTIKKKWRSIGGGLTEEVHYSWDHRNRLSSVETKTVNGSNQTLDSTTVSHLYDAFNRWIGRTVDTGSDGSIESVDQYFHDGNQVVLHYEDGDLEDRYLWGPGVDNLMAQETGTSAGSVGTVSWTLTDHQGSVRTMVDPSGAVVSHSDYDAYGREITSTALQNAATVDQFFGYTGRALDDETGLQNNLNRWYDADIGRWISQDPIGFGGGDSNLYRYVGNGPNNATDPDGLEKRRYRPATSQERLLVSLALIELDAERAWHFHNRATVYFGPKGKEAQVYLGNGMNSVILDPSAVPGTNADNIYKHLIKPKNAVALTPERLLDDALSKIRAERPIVGARLEALMTSVVGQVPGGPSSIFLHRMLDGKLHVYGEEIQSDWDALVRSLTDDPVSAGKKAAAVAFFGSVARKTAPTGTHLHHSIPKEIQKKLPPHLRNDPDIIGRAGLPNRRPVEAGKHLREVHDKTGISRAETGIGGGRYNLRFQEEIQKRGGYNAVDKADILEIRDLLLGEFGI